MDVPQIHKYLFHAVIKPLIQSKSIQLQYLKWIPPEKDKTEEKKEEGDEDDDIDDFDSSDSQFKLMALLMDDHLQNSKEPNLQKFM